MRHSGRASCNCSANAGSGGLLMFAIGEVVFEYSLDRQTHVQLLAGLQAKVQIFPFDILALRGIKALPRRPCTKVVRK